MNRCTRILRAGLRPPVDADAGPADVITLDETGRHRRRLVMHSDCGTEFLLDLAETTLLRSGDRFVLDDGRQIEVQAAPEALLEVHGRDPLHLLKLAWHLGNRHLPSEIYADHLRIRADAVIEQMVKHLGGRVVAVEAPFDPEGGAYAHGRHEH